MFSIKHLKIVDLKRVVKSFGLKQLTYGVQILRSFQLLVITNLNKLELLQTNF